MRGLDGEADTYFMPSRVSDSAKSPDGIQVSTELKNDFIQRFPFIATSAPTLDLPSINEWELRNLGFRQIDVIRECTCCTGLPEKHEYFSYRRESSLFGPKNRQWSVVYMPTAL